MKMLSRLFGLSVAVISSVNVSAQQVKRVESKPIPLVSSQLSNTYLDFKPALENTMIQVLDSYSAQVKAPLRIDVLDSSNDQSSDFMAKFIPAYNHQIPIGFFFSKNARYAGKKTDICLYQHHPERMANLVKGYEATESLSRKEILYYISFHEVGHCLIEHQRALGMFRVVGAKEHEVIADKFAIAMFYANNQKDVIPRLISRKALQPKDSLHYHPEALSTYYNYLNLIFKDIEPKELVSSVLDVFYLATDQSDKI